MQVVTYPPHGLLGLVGLDGSRELVCQLRQLGWVEVQPQWPHVFCQLRRGEAELFLSRADNHPRPQVRRRDALLIVGYCIGPAEFAAEVRP